MESEQQQDIDVDVSTLTDAEEFSIEREDLLGLEASQERLGRLRAELENARLVAQLLQNTFQQKYSEGGQYEILEVTNDGKGKRRRK